MARSKTEEPAMAMIEFEDGAIQVDVAIVAKGLGIEPSLVRERMRDGKITTLCERGIEDGPSPVEFLLGKSALPSCRR
jgi:hypothetical protein